MQKKLLIGGLIIAAISSASALGQERPAGNKPLAEVSYRPVGKLIYVPVQVNGSRALWFIFDTASANSIIDTSAAQTLHIKGLSSGIIQGAGKGDISADDAGEVQLTFGGLTTRVPHAKIVDLSKVPVPVKADGLLGAEFLEQYIVRIDPAAHTIGFYSSNTFAYRGEGKSLPLELTNSRLYIHVGLAANLGS